MTRLLNRLWCRVVGCDPFTLTHHYKRPGGRKRRAYHRSGGRGRLVGGFVPMDKPETICRRCGKELK